MPVFPCWRLSFLLLLPAFPCWPTPTTEAGFMLLEAPLLSWFWTPPGYACIMEDPLPLASAESTTMIDGMGWAISAACWSTSCYGCTSGGCAINALKKL